MPNKDPTIWTLIIEFITQNHSIQGAIMSMVIAALRVMYDGEKRLIRIGLEALICGFLSLSVSGFIDVIDWILALEKPIPQSAVVTISSMVGFLGVQKIREIILRKLSKENPPSRYEDDVL